MRGDCYFAPELEGARKRGEAIAISAVAAVEGKR